MAEGRNCERRGCGVRGEAKAAFCRFSKEDWSLRMCVDIRRYAAVLPWKLGDVMELRETLEATLGESVFRPKALMLGRRCDAKKEVPENKSISCGQRNNKSSVE